MANSEEEKRQVQKISKVGQRLKVIEETEPRNNTANARAETISSIVSKLVLVSEFPK
jgi:hypothetical protein